MVGYGSLNLTETSPPQSFYEPLSLAEVKAYLKLPEQSPTDPMEDLELETFISAARNIAEIEQGRDLVRKQYDLSLDCFPCYALELRDPLVSVELIQYKSSAGVTTSLVAGTDYISDRAKHPGVVMPAYGKSWPSFTPWPTSAVTIRFTSGFAPDDTFWTGTAGTFVKKGMLYLISGWFTQRIPFADGFVQSISEYPFAVSLLSYGALHRVR